MKAHLRIIATVLCIGFVLPPLGVHGDSPSGIAVQMLAKNKKVIPLYYRYGQQWNTDVKLPVIVVANSGHAAGRIRRIDVLGKSGSREMCRLSIYEEDIQAMIAETVPMLNQLLKDLTNKWNDYNLRKVFGLVPESKDKFRETTWLERSERTAIDLPSRFYFHYQGPAKLSKLVIQLWLEAGGKSRTQDFSVPLIPHTCKGDYIFPLAGNVTLELMPFANSGHRVLPSSEFAFDVSEHRRLGNGRMSSSEPRRSAHAADYFIFRRDVLAVGDGVVAKTGNGWPDSWMENPLKYSEDRIYDLTVKLLADGVEFENAYIGNYVIIDHRNGEYSAYVHLSQNTIRVKPGDKVKRGQVIAKVGNTANSTEPHLHFQLMDSADYPSANGLPVMFKNVPAPLPGALDMDESNTLFVSSFLHIFVKNQ